MMVQGWRRVCPDCGNSDGAKVERIAFHPTFRCECGYVWDGSRATFIGLLKPPKPIGEMTDEELDAFAGQLFEQIKSQTHPPGRDSG